MSVSTTRGRARLEVERLEDRTAPAGATLSIGPLVAAADFDHNGARDVVIANPGVQEVWVMLGQKDGTFQAPLRFPTGAGGLSALFVGDFNSDGHPDLGGVALKSTVFLLGNGDGTFQEPILVPAQAGESLVPLPTAANHQNGFLHGGTDGAIPTQMGGSAGLSLPQAFSCRSAPPSTACARPRSVDELAVSETEEKRKSVVLLTSFGIAVSWSEMEGQRPLADVFVVNGPGLPLGIDIFSLRAAGGNEAGAFPQQPSLPLAGRIFEGGEISEHALNSFRMGLEDVFRADGSGGLPGSTEQRATSIDAGHPGLDQVFREGFLPP